MKRYEDMTADERREEYAAVRKAYEAQKALGLKLNMARGKPGQDQLNLSNYGPADHYVWAGNGDTAACDAVNYYYGAAAVRMGIRWSF